MSTTTISSYVQDFHIGNVADFTLIVEANGTVGAYGITAGAQAAHADVVNLGQIDAANPNGNPGITAITLGDGGRVVNGAEGNVGARIKSDADGIDISGQAGTVVNFGTILAAVYGVSLAAGGSVTNGSATDAAAAIDATIEIHGTGRVANYGKVAGVELTAGGTVTNGSRSDHSAYLGGVGIDSGQGTITNFGTLAGVSFGGNADGTVTNGSDTDQTARIRNGIGLLSGAAPGHVTVHNFGTIAGAVALPGGTVVNGSTADHAAFIGTIGAATDPVMALANFGTIGAIAGLADTTLSNGTATDRTAEVQLYAAFGDHVSLTNFGTMGGVFAPTGTAERFVNGSSTDQAALIEARASAPRTITDGVDLAAGTVLNFGTITAEFSSTVASNGIAIGTGTVTNGSAGDRKALIEARAGGIVSGGAAVMNYGTIRSIGTAGARDAGVILAAGGSLTNGSKADGAALIEGLYGVVDQGAALITNFGTIVGKTGIRIDDSNAKDATTVINAGAILGSGTALGFGAGNDLLVLETGARFGGLVNGGGGTNSLELAADSHGTLTGLGTRFINFATVTAEAAASWVLDGGGVVVSGVTLGDAGTLTVLGGLNNHGRIAETGTITLGDGQKQAGQLINRGDGVLDLAGNAGVYGGMTGSFVVNYGLVEKTDYGNSTIRSAVDNNGTIDVLAGTLTLTGTVSGAGLLDIAAHGVLALDNQVGSRQRVLFGTDTTLELGATARFKAALEDFAHGDRLDVTNLAFGGSSKLSYGKGMLIVSNSTSSFSIALLGQYSAAGFHETSDGHGGTLVTYTPPPAPQIQLAHGG